MRKELIAHKDPKSPISEIFRTLRANIQFMNTKKSSRTILVTSTLPGEGKSWISSNLAVTFAQAGKTVILIDADLRKGRQYTIFGISPKPGLSNYLSSVGLDTENEEEINNEENYIHETDVENLYIIPAGDIPPNPSELLMSSKMNQLLDTLKEKCDIIIIDGTPCELVTDSLVLIRNVDTTVIVTAYKQTKKDNLRKVIKSIKDVGGKNIGIIFNKIPISAKKYEETYYYGSTNTKEANNKMDESKISTTISKEKEEKIRNQIDEIRKRGIKQDNNSSNTKKINENRSKENKRKNKSISNEIDNINKRTNNKREISKDKKEEILKQMNEFIEKQEKED